MRAHWYYRCPNPACGVAYSNGKQEAKRTKIYPRWQLNIPKPAHPGLSQTLHHTLNLCSRNSKASRLARETSEDAVTWTVIRFLQDTKQIPRALALEDDLQAVLFWGVQYPPRVDDPIRQALEEILATDLHEDPDRLTEPDVIFSLKSHLVFIEFKYLSRNDKKPHYKHFHRYLDPDRQLFRDPRGAVEKAGYYEFARNWVAGALLARRLKKRFLLINLAAQNCSHAATEFHRSLASNDDRQFQFIAWPDFLKRFAQPMPDWFGTYLRRKNLLPQN
jgi:hypothetical protein